jgi:hypothetical protein
MNDRLELEYVLPIRRTGDAPDPELVSYLRDLDDWADVTVVDGSDPAPAEALRAALSGTRIRILPPQGDGTNGKARGAMTGVRAARHEHVIIADDDVRYRRSDLAAVVRELSRSDLVRVQNAYLPLTWWARWDTGRILLNRAFGGDYGGTLGVRRSALLRAGGYRTDVLFENLELERTIAAGGGRVHVPLDLVVTRRPPTLRHFLGQRVRQAYDDFAQPRRLAVELALLPAIAVAALLGARRWLAAALAATVLLAERGRRVGDGARHFPARASAWAPLWVAERMLTVWLALGTRARGGVRYAGSRLRDAASTPRALRARFETTRDITRDVEEIPV